ncbi:hypothetical protein [Alteraurantiacibacter aquimixticola]|uniref:Uncharacterized protein n=1 Tax=Alteraurantiacibacter aquimixticola TaxID=2489173 RepID=A0A4T3F161_9SPHN|nr:hypothetical protein [Alteraurantiacibacter aquimixticola]TIX50915.1 hypothetical protein E5222_00010 [Alteraurantiacibacter aquimixticola]
MNKTALAIAAACLTAPFMAYPAIAQEIEQQAERRYSVDSTPIGTLLDDPETSAILERLIPTVFANELFQTMGRTNTLRGVQQYEAAVLTDAKLAEIQAEFDKLK